MEISLRVAEAAVRTEPVEVPEPVEGELVEVPDPVEGVMSTLP